MPTTTTRSDHAQLLSDQLGDWCELFEGCNRIANLQPRMPATALGVIQRLRLVPGESIEAVITDGSGRLRAVWTSGDPMNGLELGRGLRVEGTVCLESGEAVMRNPSWCMVRDPYACVTELSHHRDGVRRRHVAHANDARAASK